ncbi:MAG: Gfo/Idh/MocA family oxidoreductase [Oscillospiraceae bacterium]|nr:Gfo/Idh/MocA family oxidoreductase [Oscillospiraceae bacterium]
MEKIRVGTVGLGHRGREMTKMAALFPFVEVAALCDILPRNFYEQQWLCTAPMSELFPDTVYYTDYEKMLNEANLDIVIVETGADIHADFCIKALEKNINVLSDIPNVASLEEAERLWRAAEKSSAIISTGANPNYQKFAFLLRDFYEKGLLGKPYCMEAEYIHWFRPGSAEDIGVNENGDWRKLLIPIRYCTHSLGPLLAILDEPLRKVSCFGTGRHGDDYTDDVEDDDMQCAQFITDSGVVIRLQRNKRCRAEIGHHNYRVFGTEGYMERIDRLEKPVIRYNSTRELETGLKEIGGEFMPPAYAGDETAKKAGHGGMDYAMLDDFFKAFREGKPAISLKAGLEMTLPGIYAEESARRGGEVINMYYPWDKEWKTTI